MTATHRPPLNEGRPDQRCRECGERVTVAGERVGERAEAEEEKRCEAGAAQENVSEEARRTWR